jgi:hypothetical protein
VPLANATIIFPLKALSVISIPRSGFKLFFRYRVLMTERQILFDAVNIGWIQGSGFFYAPAAFGVFGAQQVTPTGAPKQHLAGAGYLETFGYGLSGFNTLGTSHIGLSFYERLNIHAFRMDWEKVQLCSRAALPLNGPNDF